MSWNMLKFQHKKDLLAILAFDYHSLAMKQAVCCLTVIMEQYRIR